MNKTILKILLIVGAVGYMTANGMVFLEGNRTMQLYSMIIDAAVLTMLITLNSLNKRFAETRKQK